MADGCISSILGDCLTRVVLVLDWDVEGGCKLQITEGFNKQSSRFVQK